MSSKARPVVCRFPLMLPSEEFGLSNFASWEVRLVFVLTPHWAEPPRSRSLKWCTLPIDTVGSNRQSIKVYTISSSAAPK